MSERATTEPTPGLAAAHALVARGHFDEGTSAFERLYTAACASGRHGEAASAALELCKVCWHLERAEAMVEWSGRAIEAADAAADAAAATVGWALKAAAHASLEQAEPAMKAIDQALAALGPETLAATQRLVLTALTMAYGRLGLSQHALAIARRTLDAALLEGAAFSIMRSRLNVIVGATAVYDQLACAGAAASAAVLEDALAQVEPTAAAVREMAAPTARAAYCSTVGPLLARLGRLDEAESLLAEYVCADAEDAAEDLRNAWVELAEVQQRRGRTVEAMASIEQAERQATRAVVRESAVELWHRARLARLAGRPHEALQLYEKHVAHVMRNVLGGLDARIVELSAQLAEKSLRLENAGLRVRNESLNRLASTDALTGALNRRALEGAYELLAAERRPLALAMLDIDHFKAVNDGHSHAVGDAVLRQVAQLLQEGLREPDCLARYGGEEFTVLLVGTSVAAALPVAERLRARVEHFDWSALAQGLKVTVSIGVTSARVNQGERFEAAAARADGLLYRAKHDGRNRVVAGDG